MANKSVIGSQVSTTIQTSTLGTVGSFVTWGCHTNGQAFSYGQKCLKRYRHRTFWQWIKHKGIKRFSLLLFEFDTLVRHRWSNRCVSVLFYILGHVVATVTGTLLPARPCRKKVGIHHLNNQTQHFLKHRVTLSKLEHTIYNRKMQPWMNIEQINSQHYQQIIKKNIPFDLTPCRNRQIPAKSGCDVQLQTRRIN